MTNDSNHANALLPMQDTDDFFNRPVPLMGLVTYIHDAGRDQYDVADAMWTHWSTPRSINVAVIRVFDTTNAFQPQEVALTDVPQEFHPEGADANGINDVHVDRDNGI